MECRLPFVLVRVAQPGRSGSLVLEGSMLVGLGCPAEGAYAGGNRLFDGSLRGGHLALRRRKPLADRGQGLVFRAAGAQLVQPRADTVKAVPDLLLAALPGPGLGVHASGMPAPGGRRRGLRPGKIRHSCWR